jgi:chromosome segregation ATPase
VKSWVGDIPLLRVIYPLKARMDTMFDEKNRIKAELDEALRVEEKLESDKKDAERYTEKCRNHLSGMEEEYVKIQSKIHELEKQNSLTMSLRDSLARQLKEEQDHIPLIESELDAKNAKFEGLKAQMAERLNNKKQHEKNIRAIDANTVKNAKKQENIEAGMKKAQEMADALAKKTGELMVTLENQGNRILFALDEKMEMEKQVAEYKSKQSIIESEIKIIESIYLPKS